MNLLNVPMSVKATDAGRFSGYASISSTVDRGGDIVEPFAFREFIKNDEGKIVVLWQHAADSPIGVADVEQDQKGLRFDGSLVMADPLAQTAQANMRAGSVRGLSIGYDILPGGEDYRDGKRVLSKLRLWEISLVTFPMHPDARVTSLKSRGDLEQAMRELLGLSKSKAKRLAYAGWPIISGEDPGPDENGDLNAQLLRILKQQGFTEDQARGFIASGRIALDERPIDIEKATALAKEIQSLNSLLRS